MRYLKISLLVVSSFFYVNVFAQTDTLGLFTDHMDIGNPKNKGNAQYDKVTHTYTLTGSGWTPRPAAISRPICIWRGASQT